jgi:hypothetical protein
MHQPSGNLVKGMCSSIVSGLGVLVALYLRLLLNDGMFYCSFTIRYAGGFNVLAPLGETQAIKADG